jgi:hypothetical protein
VARDVDAKTVIDDLADPELLQKTGVVVNLDEQTVFFLGYVVPIESVD